jgi:hypothetical protein
MRRRLLRIAAAASLLLCLAAAGAWVRAGTSMRDQVTYRPTAVHEWEWNNKREGFKLCVTRFDRPAGTPAGRWRTLSWVDPQPDARVVYIDPEPDGHALFGFRWARGKVLLRDVVFFPADGVSPGDERVEVVPQSWAHMTILVVPHWALVAASSPLPLAWVVRRWRTRGLRRQGHCRGCGYDLRASPDRCPECGRAVAS